MANPTILSGKFARVYHGNVTAVWLPEGDDLQARANAQVIPHYMTPGRDCPILERNVDGHAIVYEQADGSRLYALYVSREAAERALPAAIKAQARMAALYASLPHMEV